MRLRIAPLTLLAAAVVISMFAFTSAALAHHQLQYQDDQTYSSGNWIWWRTGFDWSHSDDLHFKGYAANGGDPSAGGTFDELDVYSWAGTSCDNGLTWPYAASDTADLSNSTFIETGTPQVFSPSCSSSPKYRSSSSHLWEDGTWLTGRNHTWNQ